MSAEVLKQAEADFIQANAKGDELGQKLNRLQRELDATLDEARINAQEQRRLHAFILANRADGDSVTRHEGMTIAGDGASMLGKLMRQQWASRTGVYPDGNPNTGSTS